MTTTIHVVGTIATDPRLINPASGTQLCSFRLASDERRYDREKQEWVDGGTNWFGIVAFRGLASHSHESFRKGDRVMVTGRLRMRSWEKDDRRGVSVEIEAEALGHDVRWGVSSFDKRVGQKPDSAAVTEPTAAAASVDSGASSSQADAETSGHEPLAFAGDVTPEEAVEWQAAA